MINFNKFLNKTTNYYVPNKSSEKKYHSGIIKYHGAEIRARDILCIREVPNSYVYPKTRITLREKNPDYTSLVTEYDYPGTLEQWVEAIKQADKNGSAELNLWG